MSAFSVAIGVKRTWAVALHMSASDPKRTSTSLQSQVTAAAHWFIIGPKGNRRFQPIVENCNCKLRHPRRAGTGACVCVSNRGKEFVMSVGRKIWLGVMALFAAIVLVSMPATAQQQQRPNIIFIMGDDIGGANFGVYNRGIMAGRTQNLDQWGSKVCRFPDNYAEASCPAGRGNLLPANFQSALG